MLRMFSLFHAQVTPPSFRCVVCLKYQGFYGAMGRNLITVEPMPEGAKAVYDGDVRAVDFVVGGSVEASGLGDSEKGSST